jgi:hypothetical protein
LAHGAKLVANYPIDVSTAYKRLDRLFVVESPRS